jgi:uncharacterized protein (DUF1684 family)
MLHPGIGFIAGVLAVGVGLSQAGGDSAYQQEIQKWRDGRIERLTKPTGWLSLVGLAWIKEGRNTLGSAKDNDIVIPTAPAHLGTITLSDGKARIALDPKSNATIDGAAKLDSELLDDTHEKPTTVAFGTTSFYFIQREDKYALRIKDSEAPTRKHFVGIDYFDIDPSWRVEAKWESYDPPHEVEEPNVIGQVDKVIVPGAAVFERDGKTIRVEPVIETPGDTELFLVFADKTSGKESYGAARFVYSEPPKDGKIIIDFNKAYNPPCAFTPYATCPLPTAQNRIKVRVTAGERKYRGGHEGTSD